MKRLLKYIFVLLVLIMPILLKAERLIDAETKASNYLHRNEFVGTYQRYLKEISSSSDGELISLNEYKNTLKKGKTYLFDGTEYYTRTKNESGKVYAIKVTTNKEMSSNSLVYSDVNDSGTIERFKTRVVVNVKPGTKVVGGTGRYKDPWYFANMVKVNAVVNNTKYGDVIDKDAKYIMQWTPPNEPSDSETYNVRFYINKNYRYLDNDCGSEVMVAQKEGTTYKYFEKHLYGQVTKIGMSDQGYGENIEFFNNNKVHELEYNNVGIIKINKIRRNTTCHIYLGTGYFEIGVPGAEPNKIYLRYGENFYEKDSDNKDIVIKELRRVPTNVGKTFKGYAYKGITIIDENKKILQDKKSTIIEDTVLDLIEEANQYNISYNLDGGSFVGDAPSSGIYGQDVTIANPERTGYTFTGWNISNMDGVEHTLGGTTTTNTSASGIKATTFKNLRSDTGTVSFKATWVDNIKPRVTVTAYNYDSSKPNNLGSNQLKASATYSNNDTYTLSSSWLNTGVTFKIESVDEGSGIQSVVWKWNKAGNTTDSGSDYSEGTKNFDAPFNTLYATYSASGYRKGELTVTDNNNNTVKIILVAKFDTVLPVAEIQVSPNKIKCSDNFGVTNYYYGTNSAPTSSDWQSITSTTAFEKTFTPAEGKYYLFCKDIAGNKNDDDNEVIRESMSFYAINYDANGGSGAPSVQLKVENVDLTLSSNKPTRSNYTFKNWNTKKDGSGTSYESGGKYTANASATLYAQWDKEKYPVTYNKNSTQTVSNMPDNQEKIYGETLTLSSKKPTLTGKVFKDWNTKADGSGKTYASGGNYTDNAELTLYAQWRNANPTITITNNKIVSGACVEDNGCTASTHKPYLETEITNKNCSTSGSTTTCTIYLTTTKLKETYSSQYPVYLYLKVDDLSINNIKSTCDEYNVNRHYYEPGQHKLFDPCTPIPSNETQYDASEDPYKADTTGYNRIIVKRIELDGQDKVTTKTVQTISFSFNSSNLTKSEYNFEMFSWNGRGCICKNNGSGKCQNHTSVMYPGILQDPPNCQKLSGVISS